MMNEKISVIIPVYNVEPYICRCVDSVLAQTYQTLEIILIDDGSTDRSGAICDGYAVSDSRVKVIHKLNGGLSDARNVGIEASSGQYITFLDSDDWVDVAYLDTLYQLLKEKDADISVCGFVKTADEKVLFEQKKPKVYEFTNRQALNQIFDEYYIEIIVAWGKLYKSDLFSEIRFPIGKIHEDEFTTYKLLYLAKKVVLTNQKLLYYWQRPDSIIGKGFRLKNKLHIIEALQQRADFFKIIGEQELAFKTYKALFYMYKAVNEHIGQFEDQQQIREFKADYQRFKSQLKSSRLSLRFKLYARMYFISPGIAGIIEKLLKRS